MPRFTTQGDAPARIPNRTDDARRSCWCGTILSRYNLDQVCFAHKRSYPTDADGIPIPPDPCESCGGDREGVLGPDCHVCATYRHRNGRSRADLLEARASLRCMLCKRDVSPSDFVEKRGVCRACDYRRTKKRKRAA